MFYPNKSIASARSVLKPLWITLGALLLVLALAGCASPQASSSSSSSASSQAASSSQSESSAANVAAESSSESSENGAPVADIPIKVTVVVDASAAESLGFKPVMAEGEYEMTQGQTAYVALEKTGLEVEGSPEYVTSIDGLAENVLGQTSGWMYEVNGETPMVPANDFGLKDGDKVRWYYTSF